MNMSDLIENTNLVYVDQKKVEEYQRQAKRPVGLYKKSTSPPENKHKKIDQPKNKSPTNDQKKMKDIIYKVPGSMPATMMSMGSGKQLRPAKKANSGVFSEEECIEVLTAKLNEMQNKQNEMEAHFQLTIQKIKAEIKKSDAEFQNDAKQLQRVKSQLRDTKRDIQSLVDIARNSKKADDPSRSTLSGRYMKDAQNTIRSFKQLQ